MSLQPGTVVDSYEIIEQRATDLLSSTYTAKQIESEEWVLLRTFFEGREVSDAFQLEFPLVAEKLAHLDHPHLEKVLGYGKLGQGVYLVLEMDACEPFEKTCVLPVQAKQAAGILVQVAQALDYLHGQGLTHGDLSLKSTLMQAEGEVKLSGYGLYKLLSSEVAWSMPDSMLLLGIGDLACKAPEQVAGREPGSQADLFALGAMFFQLVTGQEAFAGSGPVEGALLKSRRAVGWPKKRPPQLPEGALKFIHKCLARKPELRFKNAALALKALRKLASGKKVWIGVRRECLFDAPKRPPYALYALLALLVAVIGTGAGYYQLQYAPAQAAAQTASAVAWIAMQPTSTFTPSPTATHTPTPTLTFTITPTSTPTLTPTPRPTFAVTLGAGNVTGLSLLASVDFSGELISGKMPDGVARTRIKQVMQFSPDSQYLVASGLTYHGLVLSGENLELVQTVSGRIPPGSAFSPDSKTLIVILNETVNLPVSKLSVSGEYLQLGSPTNWQKRPVLGPYEELSAVNYTPDGKLVVMGSGRKTRTYDVSTQQEIEIREGGEYGCQVNRAKTNREFISAYSSIGFLFEWDPLTQFICSYAKVNAVLSPDRSMMAYINNHGLIQVDDMNGGQMLWRMLIQAKSFDFSPDSSMLVVNAGGRLTLWNARTGAQLYEFPDFIGDADVLRFSPSGKRIALMNKSGKISLFGVFLQ